MKRSREITIYLLQALLTILVLCSGCREAVRGPLSVEEVLKAHVRLPIHAVDSDSGYRDLDTVYYYFGNSPELRLDTYFTVKNSEGIAVRVAKMSTCSLSGQLVNVNETNGSLTVPITWAKEGGGACKVFSDTYRNERIAGDSFQTCLYWMDEDLYQYKLYAVWSEEETVGLANSLSVLQEGSE